LSGASTALMARARASITRVSLCLSRNCTSVAPALRDQPRQHRGIAADGLFGIDQARGEGQRASRTPSRTHVLEAS